MARLLLSNCGTRAQMPRGMQELISPTRDQTHIPCIRRWIATHSSNLAWKNPTDRGAWEAAVHGVTKNWTQLSDLTSLSQPLDTWEVLRLFKKCLLVFKAEHLECSTFFFFFFGFKIHILVFRSSIFSNSIK